MSTTTVNAPHSIGIALRLSKGNRVTLTQHIGTDSVVLGKPIAVDDHGKLTQWRRWDWTLCDCTIEITPDEDVDIHAIQIIQPHNPRQDPRPRRKGKRLPFVEPQTSTPEVV